MDSESKSVRDFSKIQEGQFLDDWFVFRNERHFGPLTTQQVSRFLYKKQISITHYIWRPGLEEWLPIETVESFRAIGSKEVNFLSDDEFSRAVKLGEIDRILTDKEAITEKEEVSVIKSKRPLLRKQFYNPKLSFLKKISYVFSELRKNKFVISLVLVGGDLVFFYNVSFVSV